MAPKLDPAVVKALSLDVAVTSIASHGSSGFSSTAKLATQVGGDEKVYFIKMGDGKDAETMFAGEYSILMATLQKEASFLLRTSCLGCLGLVFNLIGRDF
jgi:protein-ribulosamine 3-kinase